VRLRVSQKYIFFHVSVIVPEIKNIGGIMREPYVYCTFCGGGIEEEYSPVWHVDDVDGIAIHKAEIHGKCISCARRWFIILGEPDPMSSIYCEILSIELTM
jgi:hypothetical protein